MPPKLQRTTRTQMMAGPAGREAIPEVSASLHGLSGVLPRLVEADLDSITANPDQPRTVFDEEALGLLAESIKRYGLQQPILVRETEEVGHYRLVAGERRLRAHRMLGRSTIPAIITKGKPEELALIENVQRVDLDAVDLARGLKALIDTQGFSQVEAGAVVGLSDSETSRRLSILTLPSDILAEYQAAPDTVSKSALYELAAVEGENAQRALWNQARGGMTVREMRAAKPRTRQNLEPLRVLGTSLNRIGKDIGAVRAVRSAMVAEHRERLHQLRQEIDDLLSE
ncbi:ParB/RepB/Spo0J family partition protein [Azospirillum sp. YIM DDC1]|uniref:ParB/RepB/Spo0J family partition protein n=1 Tax=Azospirillum aestuarii TaxID=2802052 RepID=A0ABS1I5R6_9PROT|nr:ParB/RepB/Spo0J family partition protein [Azospirillum aestuarii]MBK4722405.1 ParB/RepB/Spo0J family partition protein [Azospirillum aestuarii]